MKEGDRTNKGTGKECGKLRDGGKGMKDGDG
jgi:hypothetical protein